jgi:hypothetical protein
MVKLFQDWEKEIREYCNANKLSFEKLAHLVKCWNKTSISFAYHNPDFRADEGWQDIPMPCVLKVEKVDGELVFTQTEHTKKYLAG